MSLALAVSVSDFFKKSFEKCAQLQRLSRLPVAHERDDPVIDRIDMSIDDLQRVVALRALRSSDAFAAAASPAALAQRLPAIAGA